MSTDDYIAKQEGVPELFVAMSYFMLHMWLSLNSVWLVFENGEELISSRNALRRVKGKADGNGN